MSLKAIVGNKLQKIFLVFSTSLDFTKDFTVDSAVGESKVNKCPLGIDQGVSFPALRRQVLP